MPEAIIPSVTWYYNDAEVLAVIAEGGNTIREVFPNDLKRYSFLSVQS